MAGGCEERAQYGQFGDRGRESPRRFGRQVARPPQDFHRPKAAMTTATDCTAPTQADAVGHGLVS